MEYGARAFFRLYCVYFFYGARYCMPDDNCHCRAMSRLHIQLTRAQIIHHSPMERSPAMECRTFQSSACRWRLNRSPYTFMRQTNRANETLANAGYANPVQGNTGLIRSAFRQSDDATIYSVFHPSQHDVLHVPQLNSGAHEGPERPNSPRE